MNFLYRLTKAQRGVYTIITALMMVALLGFIGLAIDASRQQAVHTELQNAADSCALAAAMEFNGLPDATARAYFAGSYVGGQRNYKYFQDALVGQNITVAFSSTLVGPYVPYTSQSGSSVKFVRCTVTENNFVNMFLSVVGIGKSNLTASGVASLQPSQSACALPMGICKGSKADATNFGYAINDTITLGSTQNSGYFTWANVLDSSTTGGLSPLVNAFTSYGVCNVNTKSGRCIGIQTGAVSSLYEAWNSRFGMYKSGSGNLTPAQAIPDLTGYGYKPPPTGGAFSDYAIRAAARTPYQGSIPGYNPVSNVHNLYGASNRRLGLMPVVDCSSASCGSGAKPIIGWACILMLSPIKSPENPQIQYLGRADAIGSPCVTAGVPGGADATGPLVPGLVQ